MATGTRVEVDIKNIVEFENYDVTVARKTCPQLSSNVHDEWSEAHGRWSMMIGRLDQVRTRQDFENAFTNV